MFLCLKTEKKKKKNRKRKKKRKKRGYLPFSKKNLFLQ